MKIGIDISQLAYPGTGVATFLEKWLDSLLETDKDNTYVLFYSSLRKSLSPEFLKYQNNPRVELKTFKIPPGALDFLWNKTHKMPIENFIGPVDIFITSDWTEPPARAKKGTIIYDMIVYKYPNETHKKIVETQKRKHKWVKKESSFIFTISKSSKRDIEEILNLSPDKVNVIYPGL
jgi:hypothetical protein